MLKIGVEIIIDINQNQFKTNTKNKILLTVQINIKTILS